MLRDTPHARVSVSCVLEASFLNDRVSTEVRREPLFGSELHARFLARKYSTWAKEPSQCLFLREFRFSVSFRVQALAAAAYAQPKRLNSTKTVKLLLSGKHDSWMQAFAAGVILTNCNQPLTSVTHPYVLAIGPFSSRNVHLSSVNGSGHVLAA